MRHRTHNGWSLTELLVVIAIIALLVTLSFPAYSFIKAKMNFAACVGNLKSLHGGLSVALQDNAMVWPQYPGDLESLGDDSQGKLGRFWYETLKPYGVPRKTWICPGDRDGRENDEGNDETFSPSYGVTLFDDTPSSAYHWFQPWVIESNQNHGRNQGPNIIMPDGNVRQGVGIEVAPPGD